MTKKYSYIYKTSVSILRQDLTQSFRTALGQHDFLENLLFKLELKDGTLGYGEAAIATHITQETLRKTKGNLILTGRALVGENAYNYLDISAKLHEKLPANKAAVCAIEMALLDALTKQLRIPLWRLFGDKPAKLHTDITIVISSLAETKDSVGKFYKQGFRAFKVKIGRDMDLDIQRVMAVKNIARHSRIYLDANQGYSAGETLKLLKTLERLNIRPDLIEQPVPKSDFEGLKKVNRLSKVPVCADESCCSPQDCLRIIREKAARVINVKLMKSGFIRAREIVFLAKQAGLDLMIGGMMESPLAMTASAHLASGLRGFKYIDLDTPFFLKDNPKHNPYLDSRGQYDLSKVKAGIGLILP